MFSFRWTIGPHIMKTETKNCSCTVIDWPIVYGYWPNPGRGGKCIKITDFYFGAAVSRKLGS